jgi:hypothetical protein
MDEKKTLPTSFTAKNPEHLAYLRSRGIKISDFINDQLEKFYITGKTADTLDFVEMQKELKETTQQKIQIEKQLTEMRRSEVKLLEEKIILKKQKQIENQIKRKKEADRLTREWRDYINQTPEAKCWEKQSWRESLYCTEKELKEAHATKIMPDHIKRMIEEGNK